MRAALCLAVLVACGGDDPCTPDAEHACVRWTWQFVTPPSGTPSSCPAEIVTLSMNAEAMFRNESGGEPYYYTPAGSVEVNDCTRGDAWFPVLRDADRSTLRVAARVDGKDYLYVMERQAISATSSDSIFLEAALPDDRGYFDFNWSLLNGTSMAPGMCPYGGQVVLVATREGETTPEHHGWSCGNGPRGSSAGMAPGTYTLSLQLWDAVKQVQDEVSIGTRDIVAHTAVSLEPVVLHFPN